MLAARELLKSFLYCVAIWTLATQTARMWPEFTSLIYLWAGMAYAWMRPLTPWKTTK